MSRQEFLQRLKETLTGNVPGSVIEENIRYYEEYISTEVRNGSTEEEVTAAIGDPRLIARTILEAEENAKSSSSGRTYYESHTDTDRDVYEDSDHFRRPMHYIDFSKWYWKFLGVFVLILFFFLAASIVTGIFSLLMPVIGPLLLVFLIIRFVRGPKR